MDTNHLIAIGIVFFIMIGFPFLKTLWRNRAQDFSFKNTSDGTIGFGYKIMWIAVRTTQTAEVAELLELRKIKEAGWSDGIDAAYKQSVFVTPAIKGWTLAVGMGLPPGDSPERIEEVKALLIKLSLEFGEAQFFCTHRVVEYHCWIKATAGKIDRAYAYLGENGENILVEGNITPVERDYNLVNTFSKEAQSDDYYDREDLDYPDEELVMTIAESWSVNPTAIDEIIDKKDTGLLGKK